jgi:hypothetical protein
MDRFLIFGLPRSGTTSLASFLGTHAPVAHEPFNVLSGEFKRNPALLETLHKQGFLTDPPAEDRQNEDAWAWNPFARLAADERQLARYLTDLYEHFSGIKHTWPALPMPANRRIIDWAGANGVRLVFQTRRRLARALLSEELARQSGIWQLGPHLERRGRWERAEFEAIDIHGFRVRLEELAGEEQAYRDHLTSRPHLLLLYEQLYQGPRWRRLRTLRSLCAYLSTSIDRLDQETLERELLNRQRKQTDRRTLRRIPNLREIRKLL